MVEQREIAAIVDLLAKVQSGMVPLAQCLAEGIAIAKAIHDPDLERFCRKELTGWTQEDAETNAKPDYRTVQTFMSMAPLELRNPNYLTLDSIFNYMESHPDMFHRVEWIVPNSVPELEDDVRRATEADARHQIGTMAVPWKHFDPTVPLDKADLPVYLYVKRDLNRNVLNAIRQEFTRRLLAALPSQQGGS